MDSMTTKEASELWSVTVRQIQQLCEKGKIDGAVRFGDIWVIPKNAVKPIDNKTKATRKQKDKQSLFADGVSLGANSEMLDQYSEVGKQFKVAYDGIDNATGQKLHQGLKGISESKINPDYADQNIAQQAGYSAEVLDTAKQNAETVKQGGDTRVSRTDDIGRVNDAQSDQVTLDKFGNIIEGSEVQVKFLGTDYKGKLEFVKKVSGKEYAEHYPDGRFRVPSDQYDAIKMELKTKIEALEKQHLTPEKQRKLEYLKQVDKNLKKSTVSKTEAVDARKNPEKITAREIEKASHEAGIEAAKVGVAMGGSISLIVNTFAVLKGEKEVKAAIADTAKDTAKAGTTSYAMSFANTALSSVMKNSTSELVRALGKANAPAYIISTAISTVKSLARLCNGEIDTNEFFLEIGKNGTMLIASVQGAIIGQMLIPIPVVGALVGGLVSTLIGNTIYDYTIGMKMFNAETDRFSQQLDYEMAVLKEYQARLMNLDVDTFKHETENFNVVGEHISQAHSAESFNLMLRITYKYIGIPCPWGDGTLDDFMADKNGVLTFG